MEDRKILQLFSDRSQQAVEAVQKQYGERLRRLAENLLHNPLDAEECISDALLAAWNSIPPAQPDPLLPWLYKTVRNLALKRFRQDTAQKRGGFAFNQAYDELDELLAAPGGPEAELETKELAELVRCFVEDLSRRDQALFLGRYWFGESYGDLARRLNLSENNCGVRLSRIRQKLKHYLQKKGAL